MAFLSGKNMTSLFLNVGLLGNNLDAYLINVPGMVNCLNFRNGVTPSGFAFLHLMHFYIYTSPSGLQY